MRHVLWIARDEDGLELLLAREDQAISRRPGVTLLRIGSFGDAAVAASALLHLRGILAQLPTPRCLAR